MSDRLMKASPVLNGWRLDVFGGKQYIVMRTSNGTLWFSSTYRDFDNLLEAVRNQDDEALKNFLSS